MEDLFLFIPIISISISVILSKILIFTLFYPVNKKRILIFETQGLIYFYKEELIRDLANFLEKELNEKLPKKLNKDINNLELLIREKAKEFIRKKLNENKNKLNLPDYAFFMLESLLINLIEELSLEIKKVIEENVKNLEKIKIGTKIKEVILEYSKKISNEQIKNYIQRFFKNFFDLIVVYSAVLGLVIGFFIDLFLLIFLF